MGVAGCIRYPAIVAIVLHLELPEHPLVGKVDACVDDNLFDIKTRPERCEGQTRLHLRSADRHASTCSIPTERDKAVGDPAGKGEVHSLPLVKT